jgi:hypothetical protein
MNHIDDDNLLEHVLEACTDANKSDEIERHLAECTECRDRLEQLREDIDVIGGISPQRPRLIIPKRRAGTGYSNLRAAALLIFGIFIGFGAGNLMHHPQTYVSPSYVDLRPPELTASAPAESDATGIPQTYYDRMLTQTE